MSADISLHRRKVHGVCRRARRVTLTFATLCAAAGAASSAHAGPGTAQPGWQPADLAAASYVRPRPGSNSDDGGFAPRSMASLDPLDQASANLPRVATDLNEQVIEIPTGGADPVNLETTVFRPDGPGPFPMVIFNHGKERGDPHQQARSRPIAFAREFVRRGYVVIAPNRRGFANSGGEYVEAGCDLTMNGADQAQDVAATVDYMAHQPYVDASRIIVAGASHGGMTSLAYADTPAHGVRGVLNFAGGLRQDGCPGWQGNLVHAFGAYGSQDRVPTLWFYGENDSFWSSQLVSQMYAAFTAAGGDARMIDFGSYKDNAHRLVGDRDAIAIWWPPVADFLARLGMPTAVRYQITDDVPPPATHFAPVQAVDAVPFLSEDGRLGYRAFLAQYPSRAFAVSENGAWAWAEGGDDPMAVALDSCQRNSHDACRLYAVNDAVVWNGH